MQYIKGLEGAASFSSRYIGSLVADFHRTLQRGGIFMYPGEGSAGKGKQRLLYETAPLAFIAERAGGRASDGACDILKIQPEALHQRTPFYIGSRELVDLAEGFLAGTQKFEDDQISAVGTSAPR
jgi:fructose-1,6-bisphosphatase I